MKNGHWTLKILKNGHWHWTSSDKIVNGQWRYEKVDTDTNSLLQSPHSRLVDQWYCECDGVNRTTDTIIMKYMYMAVIHYEGVLNVPPIQTSNSNGHNNLCYTLVTVLVKVQGTQKQKELFHSTVQVLWTKATWHIHGVQYTHSQLHCLLWYLQQELTTVMTEWKTVYTVSLYYTSLVSRHNCWH